MWLFDPYRIDPPSPQEILRCVNPRRFHKTCEPEQHRCWPELGGGKADEDKNAEDDANKTDEKKNEYSTGAHISPATLIFFTPTILFICVATMPCINFFF